MSFIQTLKEMLIPDTEPGVAYRCTDCGEVVDAPREHCPACGSTEIREEEGFDMRPDG